MSPQWQFTLIVIPFIISTVIVLMLILLGIRRRTDEVSRPFLAHMVAALFWNTGGMLELLTLNLNLSLVFADLSFVGITLFPLTWLGIVMVFNGQSRRYYRLLPILLTIPLTTNLVIWTNALHGLWRGSSYRDLETTWFPLSIYDYGPWFYWVHTPFSLGLTFIAIYMLVRSLYLRNRVYRQQLLALLASLCLPLAMEIAHRFGLQPIQHFNISSLALPISGVLVGWALLGLRFMDVTPVARDLVLEHMRDLMIVIDTQGRIVDINPAAKHKLWPAVRRVVGEPVNSLLPAYSAIADKSKDHHRFEIEFENAGGCQQYEVYVSSIEPYGSQLLLLRDITERRVAQEQAIKQALQVAVLEERQRMARELHDSVNQMLFAASTLSDLLPMAIQRKPEKVEDYALNIRQLLRGASAEMRLILMELYPDALVKTDLNISIQHLCEALMGSSGIPVTLKTTSPIHMEPDVQAAFYRIAQEAFQNINKHANATEVEVCLSHTSHTVELVIQDNGQGFDGDQTLTKNFGLMNMGKRAMLHDLKLAINSSVGQGTTIKVTGVHQ